MTGAVLFLSAIAGPAAYGERHGVDAAKLIEDIRYLSSKALSGRGTGSSGLDLAAAHIAKQFAGAGLRPLHSQGYFQSFEISLGAILGPANSVRYRLHEASHTLETGTFLPFSFSSSGVSSGRVVFAGYGISAPEYGYDDYAGIDARGKIAIILKHEPQEYEAESAFEGRVYSEHSQLLSKALNARAHGVRAVLFVNDTANHSGPDTFDPFTSLPGPGDPGIPFIQIKATVVEAWFQAAGREFAAAQQQIERDGMPGSFAFPPTLTVDVAVDIQRQSRTVHNVIGYLPGSSKEYVAVGAHYDHLGSGEQYSLAPNQAGTIHPGADDNASGTAGVLALARWFTKQPRRSRGVLFMAFAGEELGLLGSTHYINHPLLPLGDAVAMLNMDMIGRMRDRRVVVGGVPSGEGLGPLIEDAAKRHRIEADISERAVYGSSDHTAFKARMVPVLFFFTGLHQDYHRPTDTWDKIDARTTADLVSLIGDVALQMSRHSSRPRFVAIPSRTGRNVANSGGGLSGTSEAGTGSGGSSRNSDKSSHEPAVRSR